MSVRWAVAGPGSIARTVMGDLAQVEGSRLVAVGSRSLDRARAYCDDMGVEAQAHGSYEELLEAGGFDVLYVATPHAQHHAVARPALERGIPVLCEKALTCTVPAADDLVAVARQRRVFLMEAMWTRFVPMIERVLALVAEGAVGELRTVRASFGFAREVDAGSRLFDPAQGGGSLLDVGIYPVSFAHMLLGAPSEVVARGTLAPTGTDAEASLLLRWDGGQTALLDSAVTAESGCVASLVGTAGRIDLLPPFHHPTRAVLHRGGADPEELVEPQEGAGYVPMLREAARCVAAGEVESPRRPLEATLEVLRVLEAAMDSLGAVRADQGFPA